MLNLSIVRNRSFTVITLALLVCIVVGWLVYALFAHTLIESAYNETSFSFLNALTQGRSNVTLEEYYYQADRLALLTTVYVIAGWLLIAWLIKEPVGFLVSIVSFFCFSVFLFAVFEYFPSLIKPLHLEAIPYYAFRKAYQPDENLVYRETAHRNEVTPYRIGEPEATLNGVQTPVRHMEWITDRNGFRNDHDAESSDIVLLGDSFLEYGDAAADTLGGRLETHLNLRTLNLGKSGYGPFQYLEVFKSYGIPTMPSYAVFCFYEGNDIVDIHNFLGWKQRGEPYAAYTTASLPFLQRYWIVLSQSLGTVADILWVPANRATQKLLRTQHVYPDLVSVQLPRGMSYKTSFTDPLPVDGTAAISMWDDWKQLKSILSEFKQVSVENRVIPIVLYIPSATHIYAQYTTPNSGGMWRGIREEQIAAKDNMANAMMTLTQELDLSLVNLAPVFEQAAREGVMVYEPFDVHWNAQGRALAAEFLASQIQTLFSTATSDVTSTTIPD